MESLDEMKTPSAETAAECCAFCFQLSSSSLLLLLLFGVSLPSLSLYLRLFPLSLIPLPPHCGVTSFCQVFEPLPVHGFPRSWPPLSAATITSPTFTSRLVHTRGHHPNYSDRFRWKPTRILASEAANPFILVPEHVVVLFIYFILSVANILR